MTALHYQAATRLAALIRARKVGCLELLDHYLKREFGGFVAPPGYD